MSNAGRAWFWQCMLHQNLLAHGFLYNGGIKRIASQAPNLILGICSKSDNTT